MLKIKIDQLLGKGGWSGELDVSDFSDQRLKLKEPIKIVLNLSQLSPTNYLAQIDGRAKASLICDRCNSEFNEVISFSLSQEYAQDPKDDQLPITNDQIEISQPIKNEVIASVPVKNLCRKNCQGLCQTCGQDLNQGKCDCPPAKTGHPAFQQLGRLKNK